MSTLSAEKFRKGAIRTVTVIPSYGTLSLTAFKTKNCYLTTIYYSMRNLNPHTFYSSAFNFSYSTLMNYLWSRNIGILIYYTWWYKPVILKYILNYFVCKHGLPSTYDSMGVGIRRQLVAVTCCLLSYVSLTSNSSSLKENVFTCISCAPTINFWTAENFPLSSTRMSQQVHATQRQIHTHNTHLPCAHTGTHN